jgi:hypothetical protein
MAAAKLSPAAQAQDSSGLEHAKLIRRRERDRERANRSVEKIKKTFGKSSLLSNGVETIASIFINSSLSVALRSTPRGRRLGRPGSRRPGPGLRSGVREARGVYRKLFFC